MSVRHARFTAAAAAVLVALAAGAATAQQAQYTSKDIIDSFARQPGQPAAPPAPKDSCEARGMVTGEDGICEPAKAARGFSLPTRANLHASSASATASTPSAPHAVHTARTQAEPRRQTTPVVHRDLLITFKTGSAELTDQAKANAKVFAQALSAPQLAGSRFDISGYTDAVGDKDKNQALSEARAASVKAFLVDQGVGADRLQTHGYGASDFAVPSEPTSAKNRRVEAKRVD